MKIVQNFAEVGEAIFRDMEKYDARLSAAVKGAIKQTADGLKTALRAQIEAAGLGPKLAKTWQAAVYPKVGNSLDAACLVFSKAPEIIMAFDEGATIRAHGGYYLAIPTENVPKGNGGKRLTPSTWPAERFGKLYFVGGKGKASVLIVHGYHAKTSIGSLTSAKFTKASDSWSNRGRETRDVVMFILVPQVTLAKKLNVRDEAEKWASQVASLIDAEMSNAR